MMQRYKSHIISLVFLITLVLIFFLPLFQGKTLVQSDIIHGKSVLHKVQHFEEQSGTKAMWNPFVFSGMPKYIIGEVYEDTPIKNFLTHNLSLHFESPADIVLLTGITTFILLISLGCNPIIALLGGFAFAFCSFNITSLEAGHNAKIRTLAYLPLVIAGIHLVLKRKYLLGGIVMSLGLSMELYCAHYQIFFYTFLLIGIYSIVNIVIAAKKNDYLFISKFIGVFIIAGLIGVITNSAKLISISEYQPYSIRGEKILSNNNSNTSAPETKSGLTKDYAFAWSQGIAESFTLMIPHFYGGGASGDYDIKDSETYKLLKGSYSKEQTKQIFGSIMYWGDQPFTAGPFYAGAIVCFLFILGLFLIPSTLRITFISATVLFLFLAWGKNFQSFNFFVFDHLPLFNKFRTVSMAMCMVNFIMVLSAALGLHQLVSKKLSFKEVQLPLLYSFGLTGGVCLLFGLTSSFFSFEKILPETNLNGQLLEAVILDRQSLFEKDAFKSFFFILVSAAAIYLYLNKKTSSTVTLSIITILSIIDLWSVNKFYLNKDSFQSKNVEQHIVESPADKFILEHNKNNERVLTLTNPTNDSKTSFFHASLGGYHPAKMQRYQDVIDHYILQGNQLKPDKNILKILNARFIKRGDNKNDVIKFDEALGKAWFIESINEVNTGNEEFYALKTISPDKECAVNVSDFNVAKKEFQIDSNTHVSTTVINPNTIQYNTSNTYEGFLVMSEIYYPHGWDITLDGETISQDQIIRTNYLTRGMRVPQGNHEIIFKFHPNSYKYGSKINLYSTLLLFLSFIVVIGLTFKSKGK